MLGGAGKVKRIKVLQNLEEVPAGDDDRERERESGGVRKRKRVREKVCVCVRVSRKWKILSRRRDIEYIP